MQSGLFTARQAVDAGASPAQVRRRRQTGRWITVVGDALAPHKLDVDAWIRAQGIALTWPDGVVALTSAAEVHGFPVPRDGPAHVIVPRRTRRREGVVTHELTLDAGEVVQVGRALVTSRQRTLFDCIGRLATDAAERLVAWAVTREVIAPEQLRRAVDARPGSWGNAARRQALADISDGTLSAAERRLHLILSRAGITGWRFDQKIHDSAGLVGRADVLFEHERLVVEVDGWAHHGREQFQRDRTRQNRLVAAGYTVLRFTWADLTERPDVVARQIRSMLASLCVLHRRIERR